MQTLLDDTPYTGLIDLWKTLWQHPQVLWINSGREENYTAGPSGVRSSCS